MDAPGDRVLDTADGLTWQLRFAGSDGRPDWYWHHFDLVYAQARQTIESHPELPFFAKRLLTGPDEIPRIETDGYVIAGVVPTYARTGDAETHELSCWHFAMLPHCLITSRRRPSRTLMKVHEGIRNAALAGPAHLVDLCWADFAREARARLAELGAQLDPVEDALLEQHGGSALNDLGVRLGTVRRETARLNRVIVPLARTLDEEADELPEWTGFSQHHVGHKLLHGILDDITALQDRARSLQDELATRLAEETNRRLYIVSLVTTMLLPATFITGYFGMNTGGLPWAGDTAEHGTIFATLMCFVAIGGTLLWLRWKRLL